MCLNTQIECWTFWCKLTKCLIKQAMSCHLPGNPHRFRDLLPMLCVLQRTTLCVEPMLNQHLNAVNARNDQERLVPQLVITWNNTLITELQHFCRCLEILVYSYAIPGYYSFSNYNRAELISFPRSTGFFGYWNVRALYLKSHSVPLLTTMRLLPREGFGSFSPRKTLLAMLKHTEYLLSQISVRFYFSFDFCLFLCQY